VTRNKNVNRNANVTRNRNVNRNHNVTRNRNVNVNVNRLARVGVTRPWVRRAYFGTVVAGVTLGTIVAASAIPTAPSPDLCWYWTDSSESQGYWDYCVPQ
jgi:hypothetical protein